MILKSFRRRNLNKKLSSDDIDVVDPLPKQLEQSVVSVMGGWWMLWVSMGGWWMLWVWWVDGECCECRWVGGECCECRWLVLNGRKMEGLMRNGNVMMDITDCVYLISFKSVKWIELWHVFEQLDRLHSDLIVCPLTAIFVFAVCVSTAFSSPVLQASFRENPSALKFSLLVDAWKYLKIIKYWNSLFVTITLDDKFALYYWWLNTIILN